MTSDFSNSTRSSEATAVIAALRNPKSRPWHRRLFRREIDNRRVSYVCTRGHKTIRLDNVEWVKIYYAFGKPVRSSVFRQSAIPGCWILIHLDGTDAHVQSRWVYEPYLGGEGSRIGNVFDRDIGEWENRPADR